jgi:hypothetical protein
MKSLAVLLKENELIDFIIDYKRSRNQKYKDFMDKKNFVENKIKVIFIFLVFKY